MLKYLLPLALALSLSLQAQTPIVRLTDVSQKDIQLGASGAKFESAFTAIATTGTTITAVTTAVQLIHCTNNTGSASTLTIADGGAHNYMTSSAFAANSVVVISYGTIGLTYTGGVVITAGNAATVSCQVKGVQ